MQKKFGGKKKLHYFCTAIKAKRAISSVGLEHLPYKQGVTGSTPVSPTKADLSLLFLFNLPQKMNIKLVLIGKTDKKHLQEGIDIYVKRIKRYINFEIKQLPDVKRKNINEQQQKEEEAKLILNNIDSNSFIVLFDEKGKEFSSVEFSEFLSKKMLSGIKTLTFIVGGPYGFSDKIYNISNLKLSLSRMTFSHQMVRLIITEQIYRAFTIINGEPYHHN